jgi:hypothetical protein
MAALAKAIMTLRLDSTPSHMDLERDLAGRDPPGVTERLFQLQDMVEYQERAARHAGRRKSLKEGHDEKRNNDAWTREFEIGKAVRTLS